MSGWVSIPVLSVQTGPGIWGRVDQSLLVIETVSSLHAIGPHLVME